MEVMGAMDHELAWLLREPEVLTFQVCRLLKTKATLIQGDRRQQRLWGFDNGEKA